MARQVTTTVRPAPWQPRKHSPWLGRALVILAVVLALIAIWGIILLINPLSSAPAQQPTQTEVNVPAVPVNVPVMTDAPSPATQTEPAVALAVVRGLLVRTKWNEPRLSSPLNAIYTDSGSTGKEDERFVMALKLMPELETLSAERGVGIWVTVTSDREHPEVVLLGISVVDARQAFKAMDRGETPAKETTLFWAKLFLSADEGESWYEIPLLETEDGIPALAVREADGVVYLSVRENTVQEMWRDATLAIQDLP